MVEAMALGGTIRAVDAIAVDLARAGIGQIAVPHLVRVFRQLDAFDFLLALQIEQTEFHLGGVRREQGEVDTQAIPRRPQGKGTSFPHAMPQDRRGDGRI